MHFLNPGSRPAEDRLGHRRDGTMSLTDRNRNTPVCELWKGARRAAVVVRGVREVDGFARPIDVAKHDEVRNSGIAR